MKQASAVSEIQIAAMGTIRPAFPIRQKSKRTGASTNEPQLKTDAEKQQESAHKRSGLSALYGWQTLIYTELASRSIVFFTPSSCGRARDTGWPQPGGIR